MRACEHRGLSCKSRRAATHQRGRAADDLALVVVLRAVARALELVLGLRAAGRVSVGAAQSSVRAGAGGVCAPCSTARRSQGECTRRSGQSQPARRRSSRSSRWHRPVTKHKSRVSDAAPRGAQQRRCACVPAPAARAARGEARGRRRWAERHATPESGRCKGASRRRVAARGKAARPAQGGRAGPRQACLEALRQLAVARQVRRQPLLGLDHIAVGVLGRLAAAAAAGPALRGGRVRLWPGAGLARGSAQRRG